MYTIAALSFVNVMAAVLATGLLFFVEFALMPRRQRYSTGVFIQAFPARVVHVKECLFSFESCFLMREGKTVPWAYILAYVATEYPAVKTVFIFIRKLTFMFNAKIGYAFPGINNSGADDGLGRAGIHTALAIAAIIIHFRLIIG